MLTAGRGRDRILAVVLAVLALVVTAALSVQDVPSPRDRGGWVTDLAGVLDDAAEARLDAAIEALHRRSGVEIAIVTVDQVQGTPKAFATALFDRWGIGRAGDDNGLLVLLVMGERRLEMETGIGMEKVLDADWLLAMQGRAMVPAFREGRFGDGLEAGVREVIARLGTTLEAADPAEPGAYRGGAAPAGAAPVVVDEPPLPPPGDDGGAPAWPWLAGAAVLAGAGGGVFAYRRRRERTCDACRRPMLLLDELADDAHLDEAQRAEERLRSVDHRVYICAGCQASRLVSRRRWFSGYHACDGCGARTAKRSSVTTVVATYDHGGQVEVTETCAHCSRRRRWTRSTPRRTRPSTTSSSSSSARSSSSSSSSRSSFGGGRSRGGGAGSSW